MKAIERTSPVGIKAQEARIARAFSSSRVLVFGNTQGNTDAIRAVANHARAQDIQSIVSLGRFTRGDCMDFHGETPETYLENYRMLLQWVREAPETRIWLGIVGKYDYMPEGDIANEILERHMTFDGTQNSPIWLYHDRNLFFAHFAKTLVKTFNPERANPNPDYPTVLFFAHSYYMGCNQGQQPAYSEGGPKEMNPPSYKEVHSLENGRIYWVSTGPNWQRKDRVNFAIYDPTEKTVTLQTLL